MDLASGTGYDPLLPTVANLPIIPWADLEANNPPETPTQVSLQAVPVIAALTVQGEGKPVLLTADVDGKLLVAADTEIDTHTTAAVNVGDSSLSVQGTIGFHVGRTILYHPTDATGLLVGPVERHLITRLTVTTIQIADTILTASVIGTHILEVDDVQTPPPGRLLATYAVPDNLARHVTLNITERIVAIGVVYSNPNNLSFLSAQGRVSLVNYNVVNSLSNPGFYLIPMPGMVESTIFVNITGQAGDTAWIIGFEQVPEIYEDASIYRLSETIQNSFPGVAAQAVAQIFGPVQFGTKIKGIIAKLVNRGGVAEMHVLQYIPKTGSVPTVSLAELSISAVNGDKDTVILDSLNLKVDPISGATVRFDVASGANNEQSITVFYGP